jgi:large subunit ribosomal protein L17
MAGLVCDLISQKRITTTLPKAKAARTMAEKMVTLGKKNTLAARRLAVTRLHKKDRVKMLFDEIAPAFAERNGGYTRILKLGRRDGDNAEMAILEWVEEISAAGQEEPDKKNVRKSKNK